MHRVVTGGVLRIAILENANAVLRIVISGSRFFSGGDSGTLVGRLQHIFNIVHIVGHFCFLLLCVFV